MGSQQHGFSYVAVLILTSLLSVLAAAFLSRVGTGTRAVMDRSDAVQAEYLAEAAVNHAIWRLQNERDFPADPTKYYMHDFAPGRYGYMVRRPVDVRPGSIAAVGTVGRAVVLESYVIALPLTPGQMITGVFTGNSALSRAITGVGFRPDVVIIMNRSGRISVLRGSTMTGDQSKYMTGATALSANLIRSLDGDGFTVGPGNSVNEFGQLMYWAAFRALPGQMALGTYTGDGSADRIISGLGFTPGLVMVIPATAREMLFQIDSSVQSFNFGNGSGQANSIMTPVPADGFRIGSDPRVNQTGETYHYVCWPVIAGQHATGGYTGNGADNRDITDVGFQPEYLLVRCVSAGKDMFQKPASNGAGTDEAFLFSNAASKSNRIQRLNPNGFQVGSGSEVNENSRSYSYFAWIRK